MISTSFLRSTAGNIAVTFAITLMPLLLAVGAGTDILRQNTTQTKLQAATDAAAMAGAQLSKSSLAKAKKQVELYLTENQAYQAIASGTSVTSGVAEKSGNFYVKINGKMDTMFMALAGYSTLDVGAYTEVDLGGQDLEVALVLDNTASMNSEGRLDSLKDASKSLVDTLYKAKSVDAYLKVGIVPFADYINVGMGNRSASWMNVPADTTSITKNVCSTTYPDATSFNCRDEKGTWNNDGVPTPYTYQICDWNYGAPKTVCADQVVDNRWYGCVGSRSSPLDQNIGSTGSKYPGIQNTSCPQEITDLTDSKETVLTAIDAMNAVGETYIPSGLLWGWNLLDAQKPYTSAKTDEQMKAGKGIKAIVLMTDGDNTRSPDYPYHWGGDAALADKISAQLCNNIKASGIVIYTVAFKVTKQSSKDLLTQCASSSSQAFDAQDPAGLMTAFNSIGASLAQIRLAK